MAKPIRQEQSTGGSLGASDVTSGSITGVANHLYVAHVSATRAVGSITVSGVTGLGLTWTLVKEQCNGVGVSQDIMSVWYAIGAAATGTVTATFSAATQEAQIAVTRWSNTDRVNPIRAGVGYNTNGLSGACSGGVASNDAQGTITVDGVNSVVVMATVQDDLTTVTETAGWTVDIAYSGTSVQSIFMEYRVAPQGALALGSANNLSAADQWALVAIEIQGIVSAPALEDIALILLPPDLVADDSSARIETQVLECKLRRLPLGQHQLTIRARLDSPVCTRVYSSTTALTQRWRGWALMLYVRGTKVFDGMVTGWTIAGEGGFQPGQTHGYPGWEVVLTAETWLAAGAGARQIETSTGGNWTKSDTPNRIFAYLIREQMISGTIITPTGWQGASEVRTDFGGITYACALPVAAGTSIDYVVEPGTLLLDALLELCNSVGSDPADWLWPTESRTGTTVTIGVLRGRTGGSREIGTDRTTNASGKVGGGPFSFWRGNLVGMQEEGYERNRANKIKVLGKGRGAGQQREWVENQTDIAAGWIREETALAPGAGTTAELEREGYRILNKRSGEIAQRRYKLIEIAGAVWPTHFDLGDTVPVALPWGETRSDDIRGIDWGWVAPRPPEISIDAGIWPDIPERENARAGGGGGGGRGGGGRGRSKAGDSDTDPDDIKTFLTIQADEGDDAVADVYNDTLSIVASTANTPANIITDGNDDPESIGIAVEFTAEDPTDETLSKIAEVRVAGGGGPYYIRLYEAPGP